MSYYPDFVDQEGDDYHSNAEEYGDQRRSDRHKSVDDGAAKAQPSDVFDRGQLRISVTEFESDEDYEEVVSYDYDFSRGYDDVPEYELDEWESHRGGESAIRREASSRKSSSISSRRATSSRRLHSVQDAFDDDDYQVDKRPSCLLVFTICMLCLELGAAMLAVVYFEPLVECCGDSFITSSDSATVVWNQAMYGISIGYLVWIILDFPIVAISKEPVFLFNPMIGFLLCMHMLYVTNTTYAYVIYGLETAAMLGQSYVLMQLGRNAELCVHSIFNFVMCGIVIYALIELTRQGGYCIVGGSLQGVFSESTCNLRCVDEESCNTCSGNATQCFIPFSDGI